MGFFSRLFRGKKKNRAPGWNWALGSGVHLAPPPPPPLKADDNDTDWPAGRVVLGFENGTLHSLEESNRLVADFVKAADRIFSP